MLSWFKQKRDNRSQPFTPSTEAIFAAAQIEDEIRRYLIVWRDASISGDGSDGSTQEQTEELRSLILQSLIPKLQEMNANHFGGSAGIYHTISDLEQAVLSQDAERSWEAFLALAERPGANFGTWAI